MKRFLLLSVLFLFVVRMAVAQGQGNTCTVQRIGIQVTNTVTAGSGCTVTANLFFVADETNPAQKFFNVHLWQQSTRPAGLDVTEPLSAANLALALRNIVIEDKGQGVNRDWQLSRLYNNVENNPAVDISNVQLLVFRPGRDRQLPPELEAFRGYTFFVLANVVFTTTTPCNNLGLVADVTGSQDANNRNIQCSNSSVSVFNCQIPGTSPQSYRPSLTGTITCSTPNRFTVTGNNAGGCLPYYITYQVYADANGNGAVDAGEPLVSGTAAESFFVLFPGETETSATRELPASVVGDNLLITNIRSFTPDASSSTLLREEALANEIVESECSQAPLPVAYKFFNAARGTQNRQQVDLTWETAQEQNNRGFHVQRKGAGGWETVAFVFSSAHNGNSTEAQRYTYKDNNNFSGISQYRLLQEDMDGMGRYSEVKSVRGLGLQAGIIVYPNPAVSGKASVIFPDGTTMRDVTVSDVSGRVVKQYRQVSENTLVLEGLNSGFYTIRVTDKKANTVEVAKLVVQ